jgi:hypothetical protein
MYISRHVIFNESTFPFSQMPVPDSPVSASQPSNILTVLPLPHGSCPTSSDLNSLQSQSPSPVPLPIPSPQPTHTMITRQRT